MDLTKERCAFPVVCDNISKNQVFESGMSLRDYFAGQALIRLSKNIWSGKNIGTAKQIAIECYDIADAMLEERDVRYVSTEK